MRVGTAGLLVALVVLAGCSSAPFLGGGEPTPTVTPVSVEDIPAPPPPGVSDLRVTNADALGRAHARAIENESYVVVANRTVRGTDGTLRSRLHTRVAVDGDRHFRATAVTAGPDAPVFVGAPPANATYWSNGTTYLRRLTHDNETGYDELEPPATWIGTWRYWAEVVPFGGRNERPATYYAAVFTAVPTRVVGRTDRAGSTVFRVEEDGGRAPSGEDFPGPVASIQDLSLVALVDADGLVRSLELGYVGTIAGERVRVERSIRYADVGTTEVGRPAWYDRAVAGEGEVAGDISAHASTANASAATGD